MPRGRRGILNEEQLKLQFPWEGFTEDPESMDGSEEKPILFSELNIMGRRVWICYKHRLGYLSVPQWNLHLSDEHKGHHMKPHRQLWVEGDTIDETQGYGEETVRALSDLAHKREPTVVERGQQPIHIHIAQATINIYLGERKQ